MRPLRLAIVGAGYFARFHLNAWQRMAQEGLVECVAVCDRNRDAAAEFAARFGEVPVFDDVKIMLGAGPCDLVDVITPPPSHRDIVLAAIDHQAAVICQKPFTENLADATSLVEAIDERQGRVFIHENFRFQPWYTELKAKLDAGEIGDPLQVSFRLRPGDGQGEDAYLDRQPYFRDMARFLVHETGIHWIDTFRYLLGRITAVTAHLRRCNPVIAGEDAGMILFEFENGAQGLFDANRLIDHAADNRRLTMGEMLIEGNGGVLSLNGDGEIEHRRFGSNQSEQHSYEWFDNDFGGDCVYRTNRHIIDHLLTGSAVVNSARDYLVNLRLEDAIYRSAESGQRIAVDAGEST